MSTRSRSGHIDDPPATEDGASSVDDHGLLDLIWSDYLAHCDARAKALGEGESEQTKKIKAPLRFLTNPALRAQALFRLAGASPLWLHWLFRSLLLTLYSCDVMHGARIGPRLLLPHPFGIGIGGAVSIGSDAIIAQNVTLASDLAVTGQPQVGDDVVLLSGAIAAGPIRIGDGAVVGANSVLLEDLPPGGVCGPPRTRISRQRVRWDRADPGAPGSP